MDICKDSGYNSYCSLLITSGYSLVTTKWARIYFVAFHVIVVILIMK